MLSKMTKCVVTLTKFPPISCISVIDPEGLHAKKVPLAKCSPHTEVTFKAKALSFPSCTNSY